MDLLLRTRSLKSLRENWTPGKHQ